MNVDDLFREQAHRQPLHPAILCPKRAPISYGALDRAIESTAKRLAESGVGGGATVAVHIPSGVDCIVHCYAVWRQGGCVVPIPTELTDNEKSDVGKHIALDFLLSGEGAPEFGRSLQSGSAAKIAHDTVLMPLTPQRAHPSGYRATNAAFIRFTSGTTGTSKGVVLSHETIFRRISAANDRLELSPADRVIWVLSMSYHFAVSIVGYLSCGSTIILPANHLAAGLIESATRDKGTFLYASPAHYALLASSDEATVHHHLRLAISTAISLDPDVANRFHRRFAIPVSQALGIIEVGLPAINLDFPAERPDAVGRILPAYRVRIDDVGLDSGLGEILLAGPGILDAYYDPWKTRDEILANGWFRTGDIGEIDADGCLFVRGRSKDVINVMGMKFFPQEVEDVLRSHPGVREACVFARRNSQFGELPHARVVVNSAPHPSKHELLEHCRRRLTDFKLPHDIEFVDQLERTPCGKLLRREPEAAKPSIVT